MTNSSAPTLSRAEGLTDDDLLALLSKEEVAASNYQASALSQVRQDALSYYDRELYGDKQEGLSHVVTSEFADVIDSLMPGLMRVFTSTDDIAEFTQPGPRRRRPQQDRLAPLSTSS
jgi:hypothetical protein